MTILILGGTREARELAAALVRHRRGRDQFAGRSGEPAGPSGRAGSGSAASAASTAWSTISGPSRSPRWWTPPIPSPPRSPPTPRRPRRCAGVPLLRLERPGWRDHPQAGSWTWVADAAAARVAAEAARRPFLTTGRQSLDAFLPWADRRVLVRVVDPPEFTLPAALDRDHVPRPVLI